MAAITASTDSCDATVLQRAPARQHLASAGRSASSLSRQLRGRRPRCAITAKRGRNCAHCCSIRSTCVDGARARTTSKRSGCRAITSSVLAPTEPVEPRTAMRCFIACDSVASIMASGSVGSSASTRSSTPPWPGSRLAGILDAGAALDQRLDQVAHHAHGRQEHRADHQQPPARARPAACRGWARCACQPRSAHDPGDAPAPARRPCRPRRLPSSCRG